MLCAAQFQNVGMAFFSAYSSFVEVMAYHGHYQAYASVCICEFYFLRLHDRRFSIDTVFMSSQQLVKW